MDPPPSTAAATSRKLRLMCSYGGQLVLRPNTKSLYYAGGDNRIITVPTTANLTLSSLAAHLAATLHITNPFTLKYQLPDHDLDSLISLSNDEDLLIMLDEHHRLSPTRSRIRLFLFPPKPVPDPAQLMKADRNLAELAAAGSKLMHPKTESWFVDALKGAEIMQKGGVGFGAEAQCEGNCGSGDVGGAESMVLETGSSYGSTSSSVSSSNLPAKGQVEEFGACLQDNNKLKFSTPESIASDNSVATAVSHPATGTYQDIGPAVAMNNKVFSNPFELESRVPDTPVEFDTHKITQVSGFPPSLQFEQPQHPQFVHAGAAPLHYVPHNPTGMMPTYYVVNSLAPQQPQPQQQQQRYCQTNQPQPIYYVPVTQPYNLPLQSGLVNPPTVTVSGNKPPVHPSSASNPAQVAYKIASASPMPDAASQFCRPVQMASPIVDVPSNGNNQHAGGLTQVYHHQAKPFGVAFTEMANHGSELDDPVRAQIYKSQPPAPLLPSQYQTVANAATVML